MAAGTLTIVVNVPRDLAESVLDEFPAQFDGLQNEVLQAVAKRLGPDAGIGCTITTFTFT